MEATFRTEIGTPARDIFKMTWREFRVLFDHFFHTEKTNAPAAEFDWQDALDDATGRGPRNRVNMSLDEFVEGHGAT